ncbi:ASCH domain protein [Rubripirellula lacrimiformis]|uniref:ASCH domain protein n=1 Tax=Rubripirellula lacrimiformis TaxID=1930273 RepID=A0A517N4Z8_9BACT|nr:ASCH domain-containing protein [Rubripirellula lacrimiformis]QDT02214.1 ASCH domain protein [Rubripirellula lacrimiformis]
MSPEIRCLSVRQPWAWGICAGIKTVENRTWTTQHRGRIAIHASTSAQVVNAIRKTTGSDSVHRDAFNFGAIIGFADIVDVSSYGRGFQLRSCVLQAAFLFPQRPHQCQACDLLAGSKFQADTP